jgi:hypothetical protein
MEEVIRKRKWSKDELLPRDSSTITARSNWSWRRILPPEEAPKIIEIAWDTLVAEAGYVICYEPGDVVWPSLEDYHAWPVEPGIFADTYAPWDEPNWRPSPSEAHLMSLGCKPFYRMAGVWAKKLTQETLVQTMESPEPVKIPPGVWLGIGTEGEPYAMSERMFRSRYELPQDSVPLFQRIVGIFRRR